MLRSKMNVTLSSLKKSKALDDKAIKIWLLRILVSLDGNQKFLEAESFESYQIARFLGLNEFIEGTYVRTKARAKINGLFTKHDQSGTGLPKLTLLSKNINLLAQVLGLSEIEVAILHFVILVTSNHLLAEAIDLLGKTNPSMIFKVLSGCLHLETQDVMQAMRYDSMLNNSGILNIGSEAYYGFSQNTNLLDGLTEELLTSNHDPISIFKSNFALSALGKLDQADYPQHAEDINILQQYLSSILIDEKVGANFLIYGPPGVGKTEFVRMIAKLCKRNLYEIGIENRKGEALKGKDRFRAYQSAQALLGKSRNNIVLFDEVEDVFQQSEHDLYNGSNKNGDKAWVNKQLENNSVPTFWLTNKLSVIDKAFVRRFDYVISMTTPPQSVREKLLDTYLAGTTVSEQWKKEMAKHEQLPPALIERASTILKSINPDKQHIDKTIHRILGNSLEAMGMPRPQYRAGELATDYRVDWLNADCDITQVSEGIIKNGQARVCIYGPPGTGKSAFGKYVAEKSNKRLLIKKASDIVSPYLGESEKNMAQMFKEATEDDAILMLDEADTYLQDRKLAVRSWEISAVNEMLTQIEAFEGVFICSTNLMNTLDPAALRRFDLKIKLGHLKPDQSWILFKETLLRLNLKVDNSFESRVSKLSLLTPGDYSTVMRQSRFRLINDSQDLYSRLVSECALKPEGKSHHIGFN